MTINQALVAATKKIKNKKIKTASLDAEVLLAFILKKLKEYLYTCPQKELSKKQIASFKNLISRRIKNEPIAYLTKNKEFFGLNFYVDRRALIPRPETELLVEEVINRIKNQELRIKNQSLTIADIGAGCGCIAITLAKILPTICDKRFAISYYATDISKSALLIAKKNAKKHQTKVKFFQGDLLTPLKNKSIDVVVANLPYGWQQWKNNTLAENRGLKFEPPKAIFTKEKGLYLYRRLFQQITKRKQKPRFILGEFDPRQKKYLQKITKEQFPQYQLKIKKDLASLNRIFVLAVKG